VLTLKLLSVPMFLLLWSLAGDLIHTSELSGFAWHLRMLSGAYEQAARAAASL
jgi:predicted MarR family transcription regulator